MVQPRQLAVIGLRGNLEIRRAVTRVRVTVARERRDEVAHRAQVRSVRGARHLLGRLDVLQVTAAEIFDFAVEAGGERIACRCRDHRLAGSRQGGETRCHVDAVTVERDVVGQNVGGVDAYSQQHAVIGR